MNKPGLTPLTRRKKQNAAASPTRGEAKSTILKHQQTLMCVLFFGCAPLYAASAMYPFSSDANAARFNALTAEFRCLVCQNETLAESGALLAADLREMIHQKIEAGQSNQDITHYLVSRYGQFVRYRPPLQPSTVLLWFGPLLFLLAVLYGFFRHVIGKKT